MHHLAIWASSIAQDAALANISTVTDEVLTPFSSTVYTPETDLKLLRLYGRGDSVTQIRLDSPLLRLIGPPQIQPFDTASEPSTLPPINKYDLNALNWAKNDPLGMLISRGGAGASVCQVLAWCAPNFPQEQRGPTRAVRATASITLTVSSWVSGALTFDQQLPPVRYRIVGMAAQGTGLLAARLIFQNSPWRPGVLAQDSAGEYDVEWFRRGNFGAFGEFENYAPPTLQAFGISAGASTITVWLDVIPLNVAQPRY
jgi:hypothetical protein